MYRYHNDGEEMNRFSSPKIHFDHLTLVVNLAADSCENIEKNEGFFLFMNSYKENQGEEAI